jgi:CBS domain-containing protein
VEEAVTKMVDQRRAGVVVVDDTGRLIGIFTEPDALARVLRGRRDPGETRLGDVMTPDPEALAAQDRICYAINRDVRRRLPDGAPRRR